MKVPPKDDLYFWGRVRLIARQLKSDGCTGVPEFYRDACLLHDLLYRSGCDLDGKPITRKEADAAMKQVIQDRSKLGRFSPLSWWRYGAVRLFGAKSWKGAV